MSTPIPATPTSRARKGVLLACAVLLVGMAWHIGQAYWQCDDAYISFRYVRNFIDGHGLVFNPGEYVEGYTNFAWVLELAALWKWFGMRPEIGANVLSILFTVGALGCIAGLIWRIRAEYVRLWVLFGTLLLLATSHTWAVWSTSGLETRQFTFFVLLGIVLTAHAGLDPRRLRGASLAFVGAELTRPDGALLWACAGFWLILEMIHARRFAWRSALAYGVPFVLIVAAHFLWRHAYYGDWVPNTYYAKYLRPWPEAGFRYFAAGGIEGGAWFMIPLAVVGAVHRSRLGDRTHWLAAICVVAHVLYLVRIGGDHFELRPLDFYWPLLMIAAVEGMWVSGAWVARRASRRRVGWTVAVALLALATLYSTVVQTAKLSVSMRHDTRENSHHMTIRLNREEHAWLYRIPPLAPLIDAYNDLQAYLLPHGVGLPWREHERFWRAEMENWSPYEAPSLSGSLPTEGVCARGSTGVYGFYIPTNVLVDMLGLTDRYVARLPPTRENAQRYMAHDRAAPMAYLEERGFNILYAPFRASMRAAFLTGHYAIRVNDDYWLPFVTKKPEWVRSKAAEYEIWSLIAGKEIGCFQPGIDHGWTLTGAPLEGRELEAMPHTPVVAWPLPCAATYGLSTRAPDQGGKGVCRAVSPRFYITEANELQFRARGAGHCTIRVVDSNGTELGSMSPQEPDWLLPLHISLFSSPNREAFVEVVDPDDDSWVEFAAVAILHPERMRGR